MSFTPDVEKPARDDELLSSGRVTPAPVDLEASKEHTLTLSDTQQRKILPAWQWILTLAGLYCGALLYGLDTTIAADVQTAVYERFNDIELLPWVGVGFPMSSVAGILFYGRLFGTFDTKILFLQSMFLFEVGSALCGAAPNMNALIVGRVIAGWGGSGIYLGALTYISVYSEPKRLPLYNALIGLSWGVGAILGPVIGGAFSVSNATWRWAFYINLPLAAVFSPIYFFIAPSWNPQPKLTIREKLAGLDWVGSVLNGATFTLVIVALTFSGSTFAWGSGAAIALWVVWGVVLIAFVAQQYFSLFTTPARRIFPVHFLKSRDMMLLFICTACAATVAANTLYYIPIFFAFTRGDTALEAAVRLMPFIIVFIFFIMLAGGTLPVVGRYALYYIIGGALILAGSAAMFTIRSTTSTGKIYGYEILIAAGCGLVFQNAYAVASAKVAKEDKANAIGFINVAQIGFTAIALAIAGCLYENLGQRYLTHALRDHDLPPGFALAALGGIGSKTLASMGQDVLDQTIRTVAFTVSRVFGMAMAAAALLFVSSLFMKQEKVDLSESTAGG